MIIESVTLAVLVVVALLLALQWRRSRCSREDHQFLESILRVAGVLVLVMDRQGRILTFNQACEVASGYRFAEAKGRYPWEFLLPEETVEPVKRVFACLSAGQFPNHYRNEWLTRDGRRRQIDWSNTALTDRHGEVTYVIATGIDITDRLQAEAERKGIEARLQALFDTMTQGVVYHDRQGHITHANAAAERILGLTQDQLKGRTSLDPRWHCVTEDGQDYPGSEHPAMQAFRLGKPVTGVVMGVFHPKENRHRWILVDAIPQYHYEETVPHEVIATFTDITERKLARDALIRSETRFRNLVETSSDWIWEVDAEGRYTYASPQVAEMIGYAPREVLGKTPFDFMPADEAERIGRIFRHLVERKTGFSMLENTNRHRDGHLVVLESSGVPILGDHGNLLGYRGVDRDISERKKAEETLRRHDAELVRLHEQIAAEQALAKDIMDHMNRRHAIDDPAIQHWSESCDGFNGDLLAFNRAPDGRLCMMLTDATGHGLPAAVCLMPAATVFYGMTKRGMPLTEIVEEINRQLLANLPTGHFLSAALFAIDPTNCTLEWWLGGMPPALLLNRHGELATRLESRNLPLGVSDDERAVISTRQIKGIDDYRIMACTDGLFEAENAAGEAFGEARLLAALNGQDSQDWLASVQRAMADHLGGLRAHDDMTVVLLDYAAACQTGRCNAAESPPR